MTLMTKSIPLLRFPTFKDSWKRWLLDQFATRGSGHTPSKSHPEYYGGDIDWISLADSNRLDNGYIDKTKSKITDLGLKHSSAVLHPAGTVILSRDAGVGKSAVMKQPMAVSQHFIVWRPTSGISAGWFIYYWLQIMKPEFERIAIGSTIKTIGLPYFKKLEISAPTVLEQQKIADFLTAVDKRIQQLSQKKALLEDYKKGVMQQLFTQTLRFKDDHGNEFPDWEEKTLGELFIFKNGFNAEKNQYGTGVKFINVLDVLSPRPITYKRIIGQVEIPAKDFPKFEVKFGDLLFQRSSETREEVGQANVYLDKERSAGFGGFVIRGQPKAKFDSLFMNYLLRTPIARNEITTKSGGSTRYNVSQDTLGEARIVMPSSLPEQTKIVNFLTALDRKIETVAQQITHTQTFKKGLLQQMFV
ncbi:MAG: restriction endonuclease subunit S [Verrucomicrobia bacterium]|nr:restriction endonuclease subunit S [Verrucomicrobiota bacterium]